MLRCIPSLATAVAALFVGAGCNTVSTSSIRDPGSPTFPPSDPTKVEVVRAEPTRPHVRLGEVRPVPFSTSVDVKTIETALRQEAAKLGADAVVVVEDRVQATGKMVRAASSSRSVDPVDQRIITAGQSSTNDAPHLYPSTNLACNPR
jgi:hypothetical protein